MPDTMQTLDLRGEICPYPLFETKAAVQRLPVGGRLEVLIDYPLALDNVTRWATNAGHTVVEVEEVAASEWRIVIERG
jgi:tRNA 2-thiouridine synthesizing protein A